MINHLQPIDMAMIKAGRDSAQMSISHYIDIPGENQMLECLTRAHRVRSALIAHGAYKIKQVGGEKI